MELTSIWNRKTPRQAVPVPAAVTEGHHGLWDTSAAAGIPALPLLGVLPLRRLLPQDVHSLLDYKGSLSMVVGGLLAESGTARRVGWVLGGAGLAVSALTDYRLSLAKVIPIEVHEAIDYLWAFGVIAAPFVFGYARREKWLALAQVVLGAAHIAGSLLTDYRAQRGVQWGRGRVTDLGPVGA